LFVLGFWKSDAKATQRTLKDYLTAQKPQDRVFKTDEFLAQGHATPAHDLVDFIEGKVFKPTPDGLVYKEAPSTLLDSNGAKVQQWSGPKSRAIRRGGKHDVYGTRLMKPLDTSPTPGVDGATPEASGRRKVPSPQTLPDGE